MQLSICAELYQAFNYFIVPQSYIVQDAVYVVKLINLSRFSLDIEVAPKISSIYLL